mgnify:CR=1 FL=1
MGIGELENDSKELSITAACMLACLVLSYLFFVVIRHQISFFLFVSTAVNRYIINWLKYHEIDLKSYREIIASTKTETVK